jgi:O-antigen/teichoic acid export membrane protein
MDSRRLTRNVGWLWAGYIGRSIGYFALIVVLTHELGTAGFGVLSLFLAVALGVSQVGGSWPFLAVPVLSAGERSIGAAFVPSAYVAALATAASLALAIPVCLALGIDSPVSLVCVVVSAISLVGLQGIFSVQQTEGRMSEIALLQTLERVIALVLALGVLAVAGFGVVGGQILLTIASATTFAVAVLLVARRRVLARASVKDLPNHPIGTVLGSVGAMGIVSVASFGVAYADIVILAIFTTDSDVGVYSLAYQIFSFVTALTTYWLMAALPEHARSSASGRSLKEQLPIGRLMKYAGLWAALVGFCGVGAAFVLPLVFGADFEKTSVPLLLLLGGSGVFAATYYALLAALIGAQWSRLIARVGIASVIVNIVLDLILVPIIGVTGPAFATFAQSLVGTLVLSGIVLGRSATLRLVALSTPVIATTMLLAADPDDLLLAGIALLAAAATALWSVGAARGPRPTIIEGQSADIA